MNETVNSAEAMALFTKGRHTALNGLVATWHNIMPQAKYQKTISLNIHAYVLMRGHR